MMRPKVATFPFLLLLSLLNAWLCLCPGATQAQTLRVVSWNLGTNGLSESIVSVLKREKPDIILLQQIPDWKYCIQLAGALKPASYQVLVCSAWKQTGGQTAILSREKAYFSWYEAWRGKSPTVTPLPGGCAFATVEVGGRRIGLFSVQLGNEWPPGNPASTSLMANRSNAVNQILQQVKTVREWGANRPDYFVLGGSLNSSPEAAPLLHDALVSQLAEEDFGDIVTRLPESSRITRKSPRGTADYVFTQPPGLGQQPRIVPVGAVAHEPVLCLLELNPAKQIVPEPLPASVAQGPALDAGSRAGSAPGLNPWVLALSLAVLLVVCLWLLALRWREPRHTRALIPDRLNHPNFASYVIVTPSSLTATQTGVPNAPMHLEPLVHVDASDSSPTHSDTWRQRALLAEQKAAAAQVALKAGLGPQLARWLKQKFVRKMVQDRDAMIEAQHAAARQALAVDERLSRIEQKIQDQTAAYEKRIAELTVELHNARSENRELIRARIAQVKAEMEMARQRLIAESEQNVTDSNP